MMAPAEVQETGDDEIIEFEEPGGAGAPAQRGQRMLARPTRAMIEEYEIAHMPCRAWRAACVRGRGRPTPHVAKNENPRTVPAITFENGFLGQAGDAGENEHGRGRGEEENRGGRARGGTCGQAKEAQWPRGCGRTRGDACAQEAEAKWGSAGNAGDRNRQYRRAAL